MHDVGPHKPYKGFILKVRQRLLEVGAKLPDDLAEDDEAI